VPGWSAPPKLNFAEFLKTLPEDVLEKMGAVEAQKAFSHIPVCTVEELANAHALC
jgi:hypothetical protein